MALKLINFLKTGRLGVVHLGMTQQSVLEKCGEPPKRQELPANPAYAGEPELSWRYVPTRFIYGALGLHFEDDIIAAYGLYTGEGEGDIPSFLEPVGYFPMGGKVTMQEFVRYLQKEGVRFRPRRPEEDDLFTIFTEGDVAVGIARGFVLSLIVVSPGTECWRSMRNLKQTRLPVRFS